MLAAIPGTVAAALPVGKLLGNALIWCAKMAGMLTNHFTSGSGEQNIAQGENAIGKQVNHYGIPPALFAEYAGKLAVTESALASFLKILEEQQVASGDLDSKLREIASPSSTKISSTTGRPCSPQTRRQRS